jgi:ATP-dependent Clp protease ATP-binding subunit ClpA
LFQKFTEKAIVAVRDAQISAIELGHKKIYPEHLLWALSKKNTELGAKILKMNNASSEKIKDSLIEVLKDKEISTPVANVVFSNRIRKIFQKAYTIAAENGNGFVKTEHLFYVLLCKEAGLDKLYGLLNLDTDKVRDIMKKIVEKKSKQKEKHPEGSEQKENNDTDNHILAIIKGADTSNIFNRAVAKLTTSEYEILGTEQIMQSVLEEGTGDLHNILANAGITSEKFSEQLKKVTSRFAEYEDKQIIFTPNALNALVKAIETARELGSTSVKPEHLVLGILKSKKGIAYNILNSLYPNERLSEQILRPLEKQMNETPVILRFANQEARRMGRNTVGTELILIGIMLQGGGIGYSVLKDLGITVNDLRIKIEEFLGSNDEYTDKEITFTPRAKSVLDLAWKIAKKEMKTKIYSEHLLEAIVSMPSSLAMRVLTSLGTDELEIKQGIINKIQSK